ncbi:MAG: methylated-DNA--[protein]-cysteine S-methyltransferase [Orrella sp.]|jgi:AraC family transcriptional regulator, regulatory protein of adaptative response / methylated-DNA-[protein]-cysteine methyltransferase|uniref:methylated-DNA--[protein]-cysteine S-methyltransferase n=1 Tax=Orrella sp. TaxID=1921583 RepID=UPI003BD8E365
MAARFKLIDLAVVAPVTAPTSFFYGLDTSPVGDALIAWDDLGLRYLSLAPTKESDPAFELSMLWPLSTFCENQKKASVLIDAAFKPNFPLPIVLQGTEFQRRVWRELINIPFGKVSTYVDLATRVGKPGAARAVGSALAANRIANLIPCHRIVKKTGGIGQFRWGTAVKAALLARERQSQVPEY